MPQVFENYSKTTITQSITALDTSFTVATTINFPTISPGEYFFLTLHDETNKEIVKVTNVSGNTITVDRAQDGSAAFAWNTGSEISMLVVAQMLRELKAQGDTATFVAECIFNGLTGALIHSSGNITGVTRLSAGTYEVTTDGSIRAADPNGLGFIGSCSSALAAHKTFVSGGWSDGVNSSYWKDNGTTTLALKTYNHSQGDIDVNYVQFVIFK